MVNPLRPGRMRGDNTLALGLFGLNCSGGVTLTTAPERWDPTWENTVTAARLADEAGLEFVLPIARWLGYGGEVDAMGTTFEPLTWASGMLAATTGLTVFGTVHTGLINPVFAAKQVVTAHHIGRGRFGLNVVSGWNDREYGMFDVPMLEHDDRYSYTEEWLTIAQRIWSEEEPFDFAGTHFRLKDVLSKPKPFGGTRPLLISAGSSPAGRAFAMRHADCLFMAIVEGDALATEIAALREASGDRRIRCFGSGVVVARATAAEAAEYHDYIVRERGDWAAAEQLRAMWLRNSRTFPPERIRAMQERQILGGGAYPIVGSYDEVAAQLQRISAAGMDGMAIALVDYINDFPGLRDEVLPRLERLGLRAPVRSTTGDAS